MENIKTFIENIQPLLQELEYDRKNKFKKFLNIELFLILFATLSTVSVIHWHEKINYYLLVENNLPFAWIFICILLACPILAVIYYPIYENDKYRKVLKATCMPKIIKHWGEITWKPNAEDLFSWEELAESNLFSIFNSIKTDDTFYGTRNKIEFKISETKLNNIVRNGRHTYVHPIFKGVIISLLSNKDINSTTVVTTKSDRNTRNALPGFWSTLLIFVLGWISYFLGKNDIYILILLIIATCGLIFIGFIKILNILDKEEPLMKKVEVENPEFAKRFTVYSKNKKEAKSLITPDFMNKFLSLKTAFGVRKLKCAFFDDKVMFAISTKKNLFEIGSLFHSYEKPDYILHFFHELASTLNIIDYFSSDETAKN